MQVILVCSGCYDKVLYTNGLKHRHLFLIVLKAEKSKTKVLTDLGPGEDSLPVLQTATLLCHHMAEREKKIWSLFLYL